MVGRIGAVLKGIARVCKRKRKPKQNNSKACLMQTATHSMCSDVSYTQCLHVHGANICQVLPTTDNLKLGISSTTYTKQSQNSNIKYDLPRTISKCKYHQHIKYDLPQAISKCKCKLQPAPLQPQTANVKYSLQQTISN